ncbi:hypothetical protein WKW80_34860 [Variovorax humicola]|uniref:Uncharacterized protein n=1 Tax=Variovorax humicola TaxID=1769758 RepID=A0ABU8WB20_9BURK
MDWFEQITGFAEKDFDTTQARLSVVDGRLRSTHSERTLGVGQLELPTLAELRHRAAPWTTGQGATRISCIRGDARNLHRDSRNAGALFQVASQFNLLEMTGPSVTPEDGVTRYAGDPTQGPACAIATGAGTIYRNYLAPVGGHPGQRANRQLDCLRDVGMALGNVDDALWKMQNGYCLVTEQGLASIDAKLERLSETQRDEVMLRLRIGLHRDVEVTDLGAGHAVSQAYCSALPVAYNRVRNTGHWARFASLVLDAAYEATLLSAAINRAANSNPVVFLTRLGGGAFGNDSRWIAAAVRRALNVCRDADLDVRIVSHGDPDSGMLALVDEWNDKQ